MGYYSDLINLKEDIEKANNDILEVKKDIHDARTKLMSIIFSYKKEQNANYYRKISNLEKSYQMLVEIGNLLK